MLLWRRITCHDHTSTKKATGTPSVNGIFSHPHFRIAQPAFYRPRSILGQRLDSINSLKKMRTAIAVLPVLLLGSIPIGGVASAQGYPFSQRASVSQSVAFTTIGITYGRPSARGRALFGALVPWDSIWHPGADSATRITFNHDIAVEGKLLPAGAYSIWIVPREHAPWTVIFSSKSRAFHKPYPGGNLDVLRIEVAPEVASAVETLSLYFPEVLRDEAVLRIHWGTTAIPIRIKAPFRPPAFR